MIPEADADGATGSGQDSCHCIEVDQHVCYPLQNELLIHYGLTTQMDENTLQSFIVLPSVSCSHITVSLEKKQNKLFCNLSDNQIIFHYGWFLQDTRSEICPRLICICCKLVNVVQLFSPYCLGHCLDFALKVWLITSRVWRISERDHTGTAGLICDRCGV